VFLVDVVDDDVRVVFAVNDVNIDGDLVVSR
jgi:hypothetical protein